jgi:integrase
MTHKRGSDFSFTDAAIAALKKPERGRDFYRDADTAGLMLVVRPNARKTFVWYRKIAGRPWSEKLGRYPDFSISAAMAAASERNAKLERWNDAVQQGKTEPCPFSRAPKPEPPPKELTLSALVDIYIERHLKGHARRPERAEKDLRQMVDFHCPEWKSRPLAKISAEAVSLLHHEIGKKGHKAAANRTVQRLRTLFNYARDNKLYAGDNPAVFKRAGSPGIEKFDEGPRTRYLLMEEWKALDKALKADESQDFRDYILLSLYTAARRSDVFSMKWSDVDLNRATWTVPLPKGKRKKPYTIKLADTVLEALKRRKESKIPESDWVFPGVGRTGHLTDQKGRWRELLVRAKLDYPNGGPQRPTLHDLRRTLATHALNSGEPITTVSDMLGHADIQQTIRAYAHLLKSTVADATRRVATMFDAARELDVPRAIVLEDETPKLLAPAPQRPGRKAKKARKTPRSGGEKKKRLVKSIISS